MKVKLSFGAGFERVRADLNAMGDKGIAIAKKRFKDAAPGIVARQRALAPVDKVDGGQMRDTIRATSPRAGARSFASMTFTVGGDALLPFLEGRGANVYAIVQEIDPTLHHDGGQAGFMTQPVTEAAPGIFDGIGKDIDAEIKRATS